MQQGTLAALRRNHLARTARDLRHLRAPSLVVFGAQDAWARLEARALARSRPKTLAILPAAGHFPWLEAPVRFARVLRRLLSRVR